MSLVVEATEAKSYVDLDAGTYTAVVKAVEGAEGQYGEQVKFTLSLPDEPQENGEPTELWAWSSLKLNPKCKLWRWVTNITGQPPVKGQGFDLAALVGKPCRAQVNLVPGDDGEERARVAEILPPKRRGKATAADDVCHICGGELSAYSSEGKPLCEEHAP